VLKKLTHREAKNHMATYTAEILWARSDQKFTDNRYSRQHTLRFDSGIEIAGSSSPHVVPLPYSVVDAVDPEEAFVASLSSCHMLWFLSFAVKHGFVVDMVLWSTPTMTQQRA